jgi:hypothetical protein
MARVALLVLAFFCGLALFVSSGARADGYGPDYVGVSPCASNAIVDSNNQISIDYKTVDVRYKEFFDGPLDSESGWLPGFGVSLSIMPTCRDSWLLNNLYFNFQFSSFSGHTEYVGGPLIGPGGYGSITGPDGANVRDFDFRLGKGFGSPVFMITPFFGIGYHEWDRKVNNGEDYSNGYYGAGILVQYSPFQRFVFSVDALIGQTFDASVLVNANPGINPTTTLDLGSSTLYKVGLSADYAITPIIHVNAGVQWVGFDYGISPVANGILEPNSHTHDVEFRVGAGFAFGGLFAPQ